MKKYHILLAANAKYLEHAVVSINSMIQNNRKLYLMFHILHSSISESEIKKVSDWMKGQEQKEIQFYKINNEEYFFPIRPGDAVSEEAYYRLLAPNILPQDIEKILYVDCDTVIIGDLGELLEMDLEGFACACSLGGAPRERKISLGLTPEAPYYQSGVIYFNLNYWRNNQLSEKILTFIKENPDILPRWDQDALNAVLKGKYMQLEEGYNYCLEGRYELPEPLPRILHFTGWGVYKPWWKNSISPFQNYYLQYHKGTPYEDEELEGYETYDYSVTQAPYGSKIALYAAGKVGKDFYCQNKKYGWYEIQLWIDKALAGDCFDGFPIIGIDELSGNTFDYLFIAVEKEDLAKEIKIELYQAGLDETKILWCHPAIRLRRT